MKTMNTIYLLLGIGLLLTVILSPYEALWLDQEQDYMMLLNLKEFGIFGLAALFGITIGKKLNQKDKQVKQMRDKENIFGSEPNKEEEKEEVEEQERGLEKEDEEKKPLEYQQPNGDLIYGMTQSKKTAEGIIAQQKKSNTLVIMLITILLLLFVVMAYVVYRFESGNILANVVARCVC